jgi:hypothetical protein
VRSKRRLPRAMSRNMKELWQVDGACDVLLASHLLPQDDHDNLDLRFFATRRHVVMEGIRQRIAGLRRRAETAPGRLEFDA